MASARSTANSFFILFPPKNRLFIPRQMPLNDKGCPQMADDPFGPSIVTELLNTNELYYLSLSL
jgi:hypothetical protein